MGEAERNSIAKLTSPDVTSLRKFTDELLKFL